MADKRDYYEILGIKKDADQGEIKKAYRQLTRKYHPDVNKENPKAAEIFKEVNEAYEVLNDPHKRAQYDRFGHSGMDGAGFGDFSHDFGGVEDIFDMFFGGGGSRRRTSHRPRRGADLQYNMTISFEEAAFGGSKEISLPRVEECPDCRGTGAHKGTAMETCPQCKGSGEVSYRSQTMFGSFVQTTTCNRCQGRGKIIKEPCSTCNGQGRIRKQRTLQVIIPPGVDTGSRLRMAGEGEAGQNNGPPGDLYIVLNVQKHDLFKRDGSDIYCEIPISFLQAILGDEIEVPTLEGKVALKIPAGTQPGHSFRLRNKGIQRLRGGGRGDQFVQVKVVIPKTLNSRQNELLKEFAQISGDEINPEGKGFFQKVRDVLGM